MTQFFSSYIKSILTAGICAFICENISLGFGKSKAMKNALGLVTSLCIFLCAAMPVIGVFTKADKTLGVKSKELDTQEAEYDKSAFYTLVGDDLESRLSMQIHAKTGILPEDISIDLSTENNSVEISCVNVICKNLDDATKKAITDEIKSALGEQSEIIFSE